MPGIYEPAEDDPSVPSEPAASLIISPAASLTDSSGASDIASAACDPASASPAFAFSIAVVSASFTAVEETVAPATPSISGVWTSRI